MRARFGPGGNSRRFLQETDAKTVSEPAWLAGIGLDAFEYECGRGVNIGPETARRLGENARLHGIALSLHAPYYINLASGEPQRAEANLGYILKSCFAAQNMGADRIVVHSGAVGKLDREQALTLAAESLRRALRAMDEAGYGGIALCPETMGKINQLGTLDEVLALCRLDARLVACIDFGHLYARQHGELDMAAVLDRTEAALGPERARRIHVHFSKIAYGTGGEIRHLNFEDEGFGPDYQELAGLFALRGYTPRVICESAGMQSEDALRIKEVYGRYFDSRHGS